MMPLHHAVLVRPNHSRCFGHAERLQPIEFVLIPLLLREPQALSILCRKALVVEYCAHSSIFRPAQTFPCDIPRTFGSRIRHPVKLFRSYGLRNTYYYQLLMPRVPRDVSGDYALENIPRTDAGKSITRRPLIPRVSDVSGQL